MTIRDQLIERYGPRQGTPHGNLIMELCRDHERLENQVVRLKNELKRIKEMLDAC